MRQPQPQHSEPPNYFCVFLLVVLSVLFFFFNKSNIYIYICIIYVCLQTYILKITTETSRHTDILQAAQMHTKVLAS